MKNFDYKSKKGFTLIELLVVIGILAVLAAIAIPSVAGLIDRANVSADDTNANEMTNALERFTSEYELFCQDIASGRFNKNDMDAAQSRVYNVTGAEDRDDIKDLENGNLGGKSIDRDTKYPTNVATAKAIVENYTKTSSATYEPKQSDMHFYYSPDCGVVVFGEASETMTEDLVLVLNKKIISGKNAKGQTLDGTTKWINLTTESATDGTGDVPETFDGTFVYAKDMITNTHCIGIGGLQANATDIKYAGSSSENEYGFPYSNGGGISEVNKFNVLQSHFSSSPSGDTIPVSFEYITGEEYSGNLTKKSDGVWEITVNLPDFFCTDAFTDSRTFTIVLYASTYGTLSTKTASSEYHYIELKNFGRNMQPLKSLTLLGKTLNFKHYLSMAFMLESGNFCTNLNNVTSVIVRYDDGSKDVFNSLEVKNLIGTNLVYGSTNNHNLTFNEELIVISLLDGSNKKVSSISLTENDTTKNYELSPAATHIYGTAVHS